MRTFVCTEGGTRKFWDIDLSGDTFTVTFGRVGTAGQTQRKTFDSKLAALKAQARLIAEKLGKGYVETTARTVTSPLRTSLEAALVESPDDLAGHMAYGDYLAEQGDPRGELVQVQLALEDASRKPAERKRLQAREAELLTLHGRQWLGATAKFLWGKWSGPDRPWRYTLRRGWLDCVRVPSGPQRALEILASAPEVRLLRKLEVVYEMRYHNDYDEWVEGPAKVLGIEDEEPYEMVEDGAVLAPLLKSPHLGNLRVLRLGYSDDDPLDLQHSTMIPAFSDCDAKRVLKLLDKCPRLEELYLNTDLGDVRAMFASPALGGLRVLQYYFGYEHTYPRRRFSAYPMEVLAGNAALRHLHTLRLHPGRDSTLGIDDLRAVLSSRNLPALRHLQFHMTEYGDDGARAIAGCGLPRGLKVLDIGYGSMTDEGARILAGVPGVKGLDVLNVSRNALTAAGIKALRKTGVDVVADGQHGPEDRDYLYEVDAE